MLIGALSRIHTFARLRVLVAPSVFRTLQGIVATDDLDLTKYTQSKAMKQVAQFYPYTKHDARNYNLGFFFSISKLALRDNIRYLFLFLDYILIG